MDKNYDFMEKKDIKPDKHSLNITIGIITMGRCESLKRCLDSISSNVKILLQNRVTISVIIVEDISDIGFCDIKEGDYTFPVVHIKNKTRVGVPNARNTIVQMATGKYVLFIDDDNLIKDDMILNLLNFAKNHDFGVIGPQAYSPYNMKKTYSGMKRSKLLGRNIEVYSDEYFFEVDDVQNCFMFDLEFARRNKIIFDPLFIHEIALFCLKFKKYGKKNYILNTAITFHYNTEGHFTSKTFNIAWLARSKVWKDEGDLIPLMLSPVTALLYDFYYIAHYYDDLSLIKAIRAILISYWSIIRALFL
ncbi:MAG: glycosyltransferase family 2 protein [Caldisphaera sp.]